MGKKICTLALAALLAGCQTHTWAPGPNAVGTYEESNGRCSIMARHSGGSYYAAGNSTYVASAMAGAAIGEAIRAQADFNDCMQANGWVALDQQQKPTPEAVAAQQRGADIINEMKACIEAAKAKPQYAPIVSHLLDATAGHYTLVQMSEQSIPSAADGQLLAAYGDETALCRDRTIGEVAQIDPRAAQTLRQVRAVLTDLNLRLINRQIAWGEHARGAQGVMDATAAGRPPTLPPMSRPISAAYVQPPGTNPLAQPVSIVCTHEQQVQARLARENGYTGGPKCD